MRNIMGDHMDTFEAFEHKATAQAPFKKLMLINTVAV